VHERGGASIGSGRRGSSAPFLVWALFGAVAVAILVTYSRLPAKELWNVSGSGPLAGAGRVLVFTNYSPALAAVMILVLLLDRLRDRRLRVLALVAIGLCAVGPVFLDSSDMDARWVNALAAVGVGIAFVLTLAARSPSRPTSGGWDRGDWARLALGLVLLVMAIPVLAADLGFYLDRVPVLGSLFQTGALRHEPGVKGVHVAVHHGHHEGLDGVLIAWSALILWRCLPTVSNRRMRGLFGACLAVLLCYGVADAFGDFWLEQIVKRGWTDWNPEFLYPALAPRWGIVFGVAAMIWWLAVRPGLSDGSGQRGDGGHRRWPRLAALIVLALAATAASPAVSTASGRPDIEKVVVSRDQAGTLTFAVGFASPTALGTGTKLQVMLDTDRDPGTGADGGEYALDYSAPVEGMDPTPSLVVAGEGESPTTTPEFTSTPHSATFRVSVYDIGDPDVFDFWVFVEVNGDLVETAPTHVLVSTSAKPWTYPEDSAPDAGQAWPTDTYQDLSDSGLETANIPWLMILLGIVGVAALLGFGGAAYDRWFRDRRPSKPTPAGTNGATAVNGHAGGGSAMQMQSYEGVPAPDLQEELRDARELIGHHEPKKALKVAEHVREHALATSDVPGAIEAWRVAADVYHGSRGKPQQQAGRIAFDCQQNVRTMMRDQAVAAGRAYHDPFPPARTVAITSHSGPPSLPLGFLKNHDLLRGLFLSLLFCSGLLVFAALGASSSDELRIVTLACGGYWLVFAALQVLWRSQGREHFWRPVYPTALFVLLLASLIFIPLLLVPRFRRWLFGNMYPGPAR
jgi:hypothetical protein